MNAVSYILLGLGGGILSVLIGVGGGTVIVPFIVLSRAFIKDDIFKITSPN
jgi:uncharacterized membrane protein YfcA